MLGEVCLQSSIGKHPSEIDPVGYSSYGIDVSELKAGIYFVQVVSEKERWVGKFMKE